MIFSKLTNLPISRISNCCIVFVFVATLYSCTKDRNETHLVLPLLSQHTWAGTLIIHENDLRSQVTINLEFRTGTTGYFVLSDIPFNNTNSYAEDSPFTYGQDKNILSVDGGYKNALLGEWWTVNNDKNNLILVRELNYPLQADTLKIKQIN